MCPQPQLHYHTYDGNSTATHSVWFGNHIFIHQYQVVTPALYRLQPMSLHKFWVTCNYKCPKLIHTESWFCQTHVIFPIRKHQQVLPYPLDQLHHMAGVYCIHFTYQLMEIYEFSNNIWWYNRYHKINLHSVQINGYLLG